MKICPNKKCLQQQGFTLIEIMIVVAIVAILAAIAYPSYQLFMRKSWRAEGRAAVAQALLDQERYIMQNGTYKAFTPASPGPFSAYSGSSGSSKAAYSLSASPCDGISDLRECIKITATPTEAKPDGEITSMSMDSNNKRACNGSVGTGICWE